MSIYRDHQEPTSDVHAKPLKKNADGTSRVRADWQNDTQEYFIAETAPISPAVLAMRKAQQPSNVLLNHTIQWATKFPEDLQPRTLMRDFPRVANMLALLWGEPSRTGFDQYMEALLVDRRGNRRGFPPPVADDLLNLRSAFDQRHRYR